MRPDIGKDFEKLLYDRSIAIYQLDSHESSAQEDVLVSHLFTKLEY